ncbi:Maturase [Dirofilaria immitis]
MMNREIILGIIFVTCGVPSFLINIIVLIVIIKEKKFRQYNTVMILVILNNGLTGLNDIILGMIRLINMTHFTNDQLIDSHHCLLHWSNLMMLLISLDAFGFLIYSLDRLLIVKFPIVYFKHVKLIVIILSTMLYAMPLFLIGLSVWHEMILPSRYISPICLKRLAIIMAMQQAVSFTNIDGFIQRQKDYIKTALWSCSITFFLYVLPSINHLIRNQLDYLNANETAIYSILLDTVNSFHMVFIFIYREKRIHVNMVKILINFWSKIKFTMPISLFRSRKIQVKTFQQSNDT